MSFGIYNCEYEHLVGIGMLDHLNSLQKADLAKKGISFSDLEKRLGGVLCKRWNAELEWADDDSDGIRRGHVFFGCDGYPATLAEDSGAPFCLAWKGAEPAGCSGTAFNSQSLTIVGTRDASQDGRRAAYLLALEAAANGIVVYSGYATGIDQAGHKGAASAGGRTFAVMPCGLAHDYAFRNPELAESVYSGGGGFISQFACDEEPHKWNFHYRNRVLAEISDATVIVQAPEQSGALITVREALDCGRDVFVHKAGCGTQSNQTGTQNLIEDGAMSIGSFGDLSSLTLGSFKSTKKVEEISFEEISLIIKENPNHENFYRFADKWYHIV